MDLVDFPDSPLAAGAAVGGSGSRNATQAEVGSDVGTPRSAAMRIVDAPFVLENSLLQQFSVTLRHPTPTNAAADDESMHASRFEMSAPLVAACFARYKEPLVEDSFMVFLTHDRLPPLAFTVLLMVADGLLLALVGTQNQSAGWWLGLVAAAAIFACAFVIQLYLRHQYTKLIAQETMEMVQEYHAATAAKHGGGAGSNSSSGTAGATEDHSTLRSVRGDGLASAILWGAPVLHSTSAPRAQMRENAKALHLTMLLVVGGMLMVTLSLFRVRHQYCTNVVRDFATSCLQSIQLDGVFISAIVLAQVLLPCRLSEALVCVGLMWVVLFGPQRFLWGTPPHAPVEVHVITALLLAVQSTISCVAISHYEGRARAEFEVYVRKQYSKRSLARLHAVTASAIASLIPLQLVRDGALRDPDGVCGFREAAVVGYVRVCGFWSWTAWRGPRDADELWQLVVSMIDDAWRHFPAPAPTLHHLKGDECVVIDGTARDRKDAAIAVVRFCALTHCRIASIFAGLVPLCGKSHWLTESKCKKTLPVTTRAAVSVGPAAVQLLRGRTAQLIPCGFAVSAARCLLSDDESPAATPILLTESVGAILAELGDTFDVTVERRNGDTTKVSCAVAGAAAPSSRSTGDDWHHETHVSSKRTTAGGGITIGYESVGTSVNVLLTHSRGHHPKSPASISVGPSAAFHRDHSPTLAPSKAAAAATRESNAVATVTTTAVGATYIDDTPSSQSPPLSTSRRRSSGDRIAARSTVTTGAIASIPVSLRSDKFNDDDWFDFRFEDDAMERAFQENRAIRIDSFRATLCFAALAAYGLVLLVACCWTRELTQFSVHAPLPWTLFSLVFSLFGLSSKLWPWTTYLYVCKLAYNGVLVFAVGTLVTAVFITRSGTFLSDGPLVWLYALFGATAQRPPWTGTVRHWLLICAVSLVFLLNTVLVGRVYAIRLVVMRWTVYVFHMVYTYKVLAVLQRRDRVEFATKALDCDIHAALQKDHDLLENALKQFAPRGPAAALASRARKAVPQQGRASLVTGNSLIRPEGPLQPHDPFVVIDASFHLQPPSIREEAHARLRFLNLVEQAVQQFGGLVDIARVSGDCVVLTADGCAASRSSARLDHEKKMMPGSMSASVQCACLIVSASDNSSNGGSPGQGGGHDETLWPRRRAFVSAGTLLMSLSKSMWTVAHHGPCVGEAFAAVTACPWGSVCVSTRVARSVAWEAVFGAPVTSGATNPFKDAAVALMYRNDSDADSEDGPFTTSGVTYWEPLHWRIAGSPPLTVRLATLCA